MLYLGCHLSSAKGFLAMGEAALAIGANTFQFFTRNPRGGKAKALDREDAAALLQLAETKAFGAVLAHAPYTLNACSADEKTRAFAAFAFEDDLTRLEHLPRCFYNLHPGSHVGQGVERGVALLAALLNRLLHSDQKAVVLLETMAGKGTEIGGKFEELQEILAQVQCVEKVGICLDTCHVHDAGYDIVNDLDGVLEQFDRTIGLKKLRAVHLNDSMNLRGSRKDRHAKIGQGTIGLAALIQVLHHPALRGLPFILETPNDLSGYAAEIALLRERCSE